MRWLHVASRVINSSNMRRLLGCSCCLLYWFMRTETIFSGSSSSNKWYMNKRGCVKLILPDADDAEHADWRRFILLIINNIWVNLRSSESSVSHEYRYLHSPVLIKASDALSLLWRCMMDVRGARPDSYYFVVNWYTIQNTDALISKHRCFGCETPVFWKGGVEGF